MQPNWCREAGHRCRGIWHADACSARLHRPAINSSHLLETDLRLRDAGFRLVWTCPASLSGNTHIQTLVCSGFSRQETSLLSTDCKKPLVRHLRKSTMRMPLRGSNSDAICENEELMFKFVITRADHHKHKWIVILAHAELNPVINGWCAQSVVHV